MSTPATTATEVVAVPRKLTVFKSGQDFCDNEVITSHYTIISFLPKNLLEQFRKPANVYFLFLSILQVIPKVTTTGSIPTILLPLLFVLTLNGIKDAIEDYRRHKSDRSENEAKAFCKHLPEDRLAPTEWKKIRVGSLVVIRANEFVAADLIILSSAQAEGQVYIETANLDGETNLKTKQAPKAAFDLVNERTDYNKAAENAAMLGGSIECEGPNEFLYSFAGNLTMKDKRIPLDEQHVVLRGCKIKNVDWCLGIAVYTGKESKIMMNSKQKSGRKVSHLEAEVNKITVGIFCIQLILCLVAAIVAASFESAQSHATWTYLDLTGSDLQPANAGLVLVVRFLTFMILFSNFIPISLIVSMNLVKLVQVGFFYADKDMIHEGIHCMPRTSDLNEELGQVEYIFSDKTGTLTCNVMDFRKFCVNGKCYGEGVTEIKRQVMLKKGMKVPLPPKPAPGTKTTEHVDLVDSVLEATLSSGKGSEYWNLRTFFTHLAINHEVVPEQGEGGKMIYSASSPDESALCYGAHHFGFTFRTRETNGLTVELGHGTRPTSVEILCILKFNSARKRSSVIARFEDIDSKGSKVKKLMLFTKGADSIIMERLQPSLKGTPEIKQTLAILKELAEDGLRTLCLAGRELGESETTAFLKKFETASLATDKRQDKLDAVAEEIEVNLQIHGITGIEDRLQDKVSDTIVSLTQAGIKVWMLTGDKTETAINIGIATGLLEAQPGLKGERPVISTENFEEGGVFKSEKLITALKEIAVRAEACRSNGRFFEGMVMDGKCLEYALEPENEMLFVAICRVCRTVVCCRVTPKQKGAVVRLMKKSEKAITLAIGDGANDCNMIQSADVGIGIRGLEGLQAFNVCDYGITQFRFLGNLVLVHGRWCYRRLAILACYMFYKNIVIVMPQYYLGACSMFSGQKLYNDILYQTYNVTLTMLPILIFGVIDQDVPKQCCFDYPELYKAGPRKEYLNYKVFAGWLLSGLWHSLVIYWVTYFAMANGSITSSDGKSNDLWFVGTVVMFSVVIVTNLVVVLETYHMTWLTLFGVCFSYFFWIIEQGFLSGIHGKVVESNLYGTTARLFSTPMLYIVVAVNVFLSLMVDFHFKGLRYLQFPQDVSYIQGLLLSGKTR